MSGDSFKYFFNLPKRPGDRVFFQASSPTQYFWYRETLNSTPEIDEIGDFNFIIFGCLLVAWLIVYFCMVKGITENPRVIHVTAIYPYVVLVIFFVRAMMLEGMSDGVIYLFKPKVRSNTKERPFA